ncbi:MAG TPA: hypothetical protein DHU75_09190 [Rikenellaceae bacterium]|nr:hypothetical protein [Rikenellaceae bacterium]
MVQIILDDDRAAYEAFIAKLTDSLAPRLVAMMKKVPQIVCSQREAYRRFGTGNVRRWVREGRLKPFAKRPGKIEYKISDLKALFNQQQDYFNRNVHVQSQKKRV